MADTQNNETLLTPKQVAEKGEQIYQEKLKPILEPKEKGQATIYSARYGTE